MKKERSLPNKICCEVFSPELDPETHFLNPQSSILKSSAAKQHIPSILNPQSSILNPHKLQATAFAPVNIALCKYWGKRDQKLNLPMTDSLSITLPSKGTTTKISIIDEAHDAVFLNGKSIDKKDIFVKRIVKFLDLFRQKNSWHLKIETENNIPTAAGLASSASGFAALMIALNDLFDSNLSNEQLSLFARLGSGSACRSIWSNGFVHWFAGEKEDGSDSYAKRLPYEWQELRLGILTICDQKKAISSREAMQRTVETSAFYKLWPDVVKHDIQSLYQALNEKDFELLGKTAQSNALAMHSTMLNAYPPVCYFLPETLVMMEKIWQMQRAGVSVYFTEDAGPNLKLLFLEEDENKIKLAFPGIEILPLFYRGQP